MESQSKTQANFFSIELGPWGVKAGRPLSLALPLGHCDRLLRLEEGSERKIVDKVQSWNQCIKEQIGTKYIQILLNAIDMSSQQMSKLAKGLLDPEDSIHKSQVGPTVCQFTSLWRTATRTPRCRWPPGAQFNRKVLVWILAWKTTWVLAWDSPH